MALSGSQASTPLDKKKAGKWLVKKQEENSEVQLQVDPGSPCELPANTEMSEKQWIGKNRV